MKLFSDVQEEFALLPDWESRYEYIIELGKELPSFSDSQKTEDVLVEGCQSRVWLIATCDNGVWHFNADSDSLITKGMIYIVISIFEGKTTEEILQTDIALIEKLGFAEQLSLARKNGLQAMIQKIRYKVHST